MVNFNVEYIFSQFVPHYCLTLLIVKPIVSAIHACCCKSVFPLLLFVCIDIMQILCICVHFGLQRFDSVGWATGRASGL